MNTFVNKFQQKPALHKNNAAAGHFFQPKLTINNPNDKFESEANTVADKVMQMETPSLQKKSDNNSFFKPNPISITPVQRKCAHCEDDKEMQRKEIDGEEATADSNLENYVGGLSSGGQPLSNEARNFYEPRFGYDFSNVKVHTDTVAAKSAQSINALAYTSGNNIVFNNAQYSPNTDSGKRLLGHELTHVVQQGSGVAAKIQTQADISQAPASLSCITVTGSSHPLGIDFLFIISSSALTTPQKTAVARFATSWTSSGSVDDIFVDGFASTDGIQTMNWQLSCDRAESIRAELLVNSVPSSKITTLAHGESTQFSATSLSPNRRAIISSIHMPEPVKPKCGPDVTDWFVRQINAAMTDPAVLSVQSDISTATSILAAHPGVSVTTNDIEEGSSAAAILAQEARLGAAAPARNPTINSQLTPAIVAGARVASDLNSSMPLVPTTVVSAGLLMASAALKWRALVNHGARYDFKAHVMNHPGSAHCPDEGCTSVETGVVTICPGVAAENCYESDLTGNIFYALIGRFIGWSERTLQLGSQLAELTDTRVTPTHPAVTWDSPEDTAAIALGFGMPLPITAASLCGILSPARSTLSHKAGCDDCTELTSAPIM